MQSRLRIKTQTKVEITHRFETKNGGHVNIVLKNVEIDIRKDAIKNLIATMG